jgi:hypothetical protein
MEPHNGEVEHPVGTRTDHTVAERAASAHRHGYDREMLREGIVQVCVKPYRARHLRFTDERALERIKIDARLRAHIFVPAERGTDD